MKIKNDVSESDALTISKSASALGVHEFSLFSRIQAGDITAARLWSGAQSQIVQTAQGVLGEHAAGFENILKIIRCCFHQPFIADEIEGRAFDCPLPP